MAKCTFVLRYRGEGPKPAADVERIRGLPEATVLDESSTRMMLVESDEQPLREVVASLHEWVVAPEQAVPLPETRERIKRSPA
ncbi:MAG: hypothetical protein M3356_07210 [Actinomycetota bacterium]|nr:hypothetical protein [Actinomycetota bacterium]